MRERDMQTLFGKKNQLTGVFELKICKEKSLQFSAVQEHQVRALLHVEGSGLYHKISDMSMGEKPFDCFYLAELPAYVVPVWYVPRKQKTAYYIRIKHFLRMREEADRKSFTEEMARKCAEMVIEL